jgi:hypothetical protein
MPIGATDFSSISVQPTYGRSAALITWTVSSSRVAGQVYVYRSPTGVSEWSLLNLAAPVPVQNGCYVDDAFAPTDRNAAPHYRLVLLTPEGEKRPSVPIGVFEQLTRQEKVGVWRILAQEYGRMRHNGVPIFFFYPLYQGKPAPNFDPTTGQKMGVDLCRGLSPEEDSYGMPFIGGFQDPIQSRMEILNTGGIDLGVPPEGKSDVVQKTVRLLAWPRPRQDCMIVQPTTDDRYVLGERAEAFAFRGIYPIAYHVPLVLLPRNDPRYRVPVPSLIPES